jgi:hypothetical protein
MPVGKFDHRVFCDASNANTALARPASSSDASTAWAAVTIRAVASVEAAADTAGAARRCPSTVTLSAASEPMSTTAAVRGIRMPTTLRPQPT